MPFSEEKGFFLKEKTFFSKGGYCVQQPVKSEYLLDSICLPLPVKYYIYFPGIIFDIKYIEKTVGKSILDEFFFGGGGGISIVFF